MRWAGVCGLILMGCASPATVGRGWEMSPERRTARECALFVISTKGRTFTALGSYFVYATLDGDVFSRCTTSARGEHDIGVELHPYWTRGARSASCVAAIPGGYVTFAMAADEAPSYQITWTDDATRGPVTGDIVPIPKCKDYAPAGVAEDIP